MLGLFLTFYPPLHPNVWESSPNGAALPDILVNFLILQS